ncbi:MAG: hypothetical protein DI551_02010 [Micavibrio aeruginosavorus]|uniref:N-acetyltransferase domain-containing protein n=1 Tax=Micavibrio aeruginosavorus TaxID=349221 RepID=A0A2W5N575_9BACT|nr:MAG: hypothetical protein DI551_02010 [Micavibrio aeruginosavorus]
MVIEMKQFKDLEILTDRLIIRVPTLDDAVEINTAMNGVWHDLQLWMSWASDDQKTLEATRAYLTDFDQRGFLPLAGFCRDTGRFIVSTGITFHNDGRRETGYWVAKDFLGLGYATESAAATIKYGFNELDFDEFFINHYEGNEKSRNVIEKLGFVKTRVIKSNHPRCLDGVLLDEHQYIITKEQWRERCR